MTGPAIIGVVLLFVLLLNAMPVAFALIVSGAVGVYLVAGFQPMAGLLQNAPYEHVASYTLSTIPMFILMAEFLTAGRFTRDLFTASNKWLGHFRGGVGFAAVAGGVMLSAISGSSTAAAGTLAGSAFPEMRRLGYSDSFSTGTLAVIGTLAIMIPPSIGLVLYGVFTETSVGSLLVAGFIPGALTALGYIITISIVVRLNPESAPKAQPRLPLQDRVKGLLPVWPVLLLMLGMIVGIYSGVITPTEVGAVGALAALVIGVAMGRIGLSGFSDALGRATRNSAMILLIIGFSAVFGVFLTMTGITQQIINWVGEANVPPSVVLLMVLVLLIVMGFFLDQLAILVLTLPLIFPLLTGLGYDPIWMGVIFVKTAEIGLITPPMGLNGFVVSATTGVPVGKVFRGVWPFVIAELILLAVLVFFPQLTLWLPSLM